MELFYVMVGASKEDKRRSEKREVLEEDLLLRSCSEVTWCSIQRVLLGKTSHMVSPGSRVGEIDSVSWWEELQRMCEHV